MIWTDFCDPLHPSSDPGSLFCISVSALPVLPVSSPLQAQRFWELFAQILAGAALQVWACATLDQAVWQPAVPGAGGRPHPWRAQTYPQYVHAHTSPARPLQNAAAQQSSTVVSFLRWEQKPVKLQRGQTSYTLPNCDM